MAAPDYAEILRDLKAQQKADPISILRLAEPITQSGQTLVSPSKRVSDASNSDIENPTPANLEAELLHYKDLFSKLHLSYLEQVTKEKFLRSIVSDPPILVSHAQNVALEASLAQRKAELKVAKEQVNRLVEEMGILGCQLAEQWEGVQTQMADLDRLPGEIEGLEETVSRLKEQQAERIGMQSRQDPRMNLGLAETERLVEEQKEKLSELDKQIAALQGQIPSKTREAEMARKEVESLERRRAEAGAAAMAARKIKEEGGRDELEEKGRWYTSAEKVLNGMVGVDA